MSILERHRRELRRACLQALKKHRSVRAAATAIGVPKSTLHDIVHEFRGTKWRRV